MMYSAIHTYFRKRVNNLSIDIDGEVLPRYWSFDEFTESGPYIQVSTELTDPVAQGHGVNPPQDVSGFLQLMIKSPKTQDSVQAFLELAASQVWAAFPISSDGDTNLKIEYNSVNRGALTSMGGYAAVTMRINFRASYCEA